MLLNFIRSSSIQLCQCRNKLSIHFRLVDLSMGFCSFGKVYSLSVMTQNYFLELYIKLRELDKVDRIVNHNRRVIPSYDDVNRVSDQNLLQNNKENSTFFKPVV